MKTIASTVSEYVKTKPYLASALSDGIINLTSLALNWALIVKNITGIDSIIIGFRITKII